MAGWIRSYERGWLKGDLIAGFAVAALIALAAVALVLIGFSQTAGDARTFAARHHYRIDINQESALVT